ncbi:hypothetical protein [Trichocoleus sp. DQ-U1]|uniref:RipA family octameric membrane protein n=1 Tax=Trichocoleus sp. DQ-U1 TaxID=2933926 RepID=UPI00329A7FB2
MIEDKSQITPDATPQDTPSSQLPKASSADRRRDTYGVKFQEHLLEQYKLYVEMIDRTTAKRNQMNSFYISLLSGLLAFISIATNKDIVNLKLPNFPAIAVLAVAILGIILCFVWQANIQSYKQLNSGKFKVLSEIEQYMPFPCYDREWEILKKDKRYQGYLTQTQVEKYVPFILTIPYLGLLMYSLLAIFK